MVTSIGCRYASLADLRVHPTGTAVHWLSPAERQAWGQMRSPERRATWLGGRVLAKQLLRECLSDVASQGEELTPEEIHIESRSSVSGLGERPSVFASGRALACALSIAHTSRGVLAAVATEPGVALGVDLVSPGDLRPASLEWCFTPAERRLLAEAPAHGRMAERLWAMKEAVYKACQQGEGFAPQRIEVAPDSRGHCRNFDTTQVLRNLQCWRIDGQIAALAVAVRPVIGVADAIERKTAIRARIRTST